MKLSGMLSGLPLDSFVTWQALENALKGLQQTVDDQAAEIDEVRRNMIKQPTVMQEIQVTPVRCAILAPSFTAVAFLRPVWDANG